MKYSPNSLHYHDQQKSTYLCGSSSGQDLLKLCVHLCVCGVLVIRSKAEEEQTLNNKSTLQHWHLLVTSVPNRNSIFTILQFQKTQPRAQPKSIHPISTCKSPRYEDANVRQNLKTSSLGFLEEEIHTCWDPYLLRSNKSQNKSIHTSAYRLSRSCFSIPDVSMATTVSNTSRKALKDIL